MTIKDNCLVINNKFSTDILLTDTISTGIKKFTFYARVANLNNKEYKKYKYTDLTDNSTKSIENPGWGIVWGYIDSQNYYAAIIRSYDPIATDEIFGGRTLKIKVIKVENSTTTCLESVEMHEGVDFYSGYNLAKVEYDGTSTIITIGNKKLRHVATFDDMTYSPNSQYGLIIGRAAQIAVERIVFDRSPIMKYELATNWTMDSLINHFKKSKDLYEGFWTYFDKDLNERMLKIGGRYTLALVCNGNGYDIIYVDGAQVNESEWSCGLLKGRITETQFVDDYSLLWYDAMMKPFFNDVYATIENHTLLSLYFPAQKSVLRFAKAINPL